MKTAKEQPRVLRATFEFDEAALTLRAGGAAITPARRDELLIALKEGRHVELELDIMPFRQREGERNRNNVRFRKGGLRALGRSGKGMPFLRDHAQGESLAVGGEIVSSSLEPELVNGAEEWRLHQTVRLSAPWAVDLALRGLIKFFSIGWDPTGPVLCSVCGKDYYRYDAEGCRHYRGQLTDDGQVVELEYQDAVLVETSCVPVPAVLGTEVEDIRAAARASALSTGNGAPEVREDHMHKLSFLITILGLATTASENEVANAVEALKKDNDTLKAELPILRGENAKLQAKVEEHEAAAQLTAENEFVDAALRSGRIAKGDEEVWRTLFKANGDRAKEMMAARKAGQATPVGQPRQSDKPEPASSAAPGASERTRGLFATNGVDYDQAKKFASAFGAKDPDKALARHAAGEEV